jgi:hypothetical protein
MAGCPWLMILNVMTIDVLPNPNDEEGGHLPSSLK